MADGHAVGVGEDHARAVQLRGEHAQVYIGEQHAEQQLAIAGFHVARDLRLPDGAGIQAQVQRMVVAHHRLPLQGDGDGDAHPFGKAQQLLVQTEALAAPRRR